MKDLIPIENEKNDALSRLTRFYKKADIVLTAEEETILTRWLHVDSLLRQRRLKITQIVDDLIARFGVSKYTAQNDISLAQALFGSVRTPDKRYLLEQHIEDMRLKIQQAKDDKSLAPFLPKMWAELTRALALLPDEIAKEKTPPTTLIISVGNGSAATSKFSFEEAKEKLNALKVKRESDEYTDYEDVK